jgi:hypothetical protein
MSFSDEDDVVVALKAKPYDPREEIKKLKEEVDMLKRFTSMEMLDKWGLIMTWEKPMGGVLTAVYDALNAVPMKNQVIMFSEGESTNMIVTFVASTEHIMKFKEFLEQRLGRDTEASLLDLARLFRLMQVAAYSKDGTAIQRGENGLRTYKYDRK